MDFQTLELTNLLREYHRISGFRISVHDADFHELCSYPPSLCPFCARLQQHSAVREDCLRTDAAAFRRVQKTGKPLLYRCKHGLIEAVAPIYHYGVLCGFLMMGQVRSAGEASLRRITECAAQIVGSREEVAMLLQSVREQPDALLEAYVHIMAIIAEYISSENKLHPRHQDLPQLVYAYLYRNYAQRITLQVLAEKFGVCVSTLTAGFRKQYGTTVMACLQNIRLQHAEKLLRTSRLSMKEIAYACGYIDQNYFSRQFRAAYGFPPSSLRNKEQ